MLSLQKIIDMVLDEQKNYVADRDNEKRNLYRKFEKIIDKLGMDKESVKKGNRNYEFSEVEVPSIKFILTKLLMDQGPIARFVKKNADFSSKEIKELVQDILNEVEKEETDEDVLLGVARFLCTYYELGVTRSFERCHALIDCLEANLSDMIATTKAKYVRAIEVFLEYQVFCRIAEAAIDTEDIARMLTLGAEGDRNPYRLFGSEIESEYMKRDAAVFERLQKDHDLREYIEKKLHRKVEVIFVHVNPDTSQKDKYKRFT